MDQRVAVDHQGESICLVHNDWGCTASSIVALGISKEIVALGAACVCVCVGVSERDS